MKKIIFLIFIYIFTFSVAKADDIRDLEIDGISVGDDALDYFSKKKIR